MSLKRFISFCIPLVVMLFTLSLYISIDKIVTHYEQSINDDYSIILVSTSPIIESKLKEIKDINIKNITYLKKKNILKNIDEDLSASTYKLLEQKLPYFYTINLKQFPTSSKLKTIKEDLKKVSGIKRVETFSKNHDNVYSLLLLIKAIVSILFISIVIFTFLIMIDNVKIWFYEHQERLTIIQLHGGSVFYAASPIIKIAFYASIFSASLIVLLVYTFKENLDLILDIEIRNIITANLTTYTTFEIAIIFIISLILSFITVFGILLKHRLK
jgi:cell division transport system permease protein